MRQPERRVLRWVLYLGFCLAGAPASAASYYVDAQTGDDANTGTSESTAWRTISKVNAAALRPGDSVYLRRGCVWRDRTLMLQSGSRAGAYILYSSYGSGAKPPIRRSVIVNEASQWTDLGNNLWELKQSFSTDVSFISFDHLKLIGHKIPDLADVDSQGGFWTDLETLRIRVYSTDNPARLYNHIEVVFHEIGIHGPRDLGWVIVDGLAPCYCGWSGIELPTRSHDVIIRNCDIFYCGGGHSRPGNDVKRRNGQGINTRTDLKNIEIHGNRIWQCWDGCIALQGYAKALKIENVRVHHNILGYSEYGFEFWGKQRDSDLRDIYFENNVVHHTGYGWSSEQRPLKRGTGVMSWSYRGVAKNLHVRSNIFYQTRGAAYWLGRYPDGIEEALTLNGNYYYKSDDTEMWFFGRKNEPEKVREFTTSQLAGWRKAFGFDALSIVVDPQFVDAANEDFRLRSSSP